MLWSAGTHVNSGQTKSGRAAGGRAMPGAIAEESEETSFRRLDINIKEDFTDRAREDTTARSRR